MSNISDPPIDKHDELEGVSEDNHHPAFTASEAEAAVHSRYSDAEAASAAPVQSVDGATGDVVTSPDWSNVQNKPTSTGFSGGLSGYMVEPNDYTFSCWPGEVRIGGGNNPDAPITRDDPAITDAYTGYQTIGEADGMRFEWENTGNISVTNAEAHFQDGSTMSLPEMNNDGPQLETLTYTFQQGKLLDRIEVDWEILNDTGGDIYLRDFEPHIVSAPEHSHGV